MKRILVSESIGVPTDEWVELANLGQWIEEKAGDVIARWKDQNPVVLRIQFWDNSYYDDHDMRLLFEFERDQTEREYQKEVTSAKKKAERAAKAKEAREKRKLEIETEERALLEKLKSKYENT